jgi:7-keto-8-aminopelargonate synthetase-like enzyme
VFREELDKLRHSSLMRGILSRASTQGAVITIDGQRYINFSSNDYLGLSHHPDVLLSVQTSLQEYGFGSGASRLLAGGSVLYEKLETEIADFKGSEDARVFNSGYSANIGIIPAIGLEGDVIFSDELNHASIVDGCRLSRAKTVIYRHGDTENLEQLLRKEQARRKVVITDTVFSMDGDMETAEAPLPISSSRLSHGLSRWAHVRRPWARMVLSSRAVLKSSNGYPKQHEASYFLLPCLHLSSLALFRRSM